MKLSIKLGKLELDSPIICASGTFGFGEELRGLVDFKAIGAITTKTLTLDSRKGNPPPRIYETDGGVINSVGMENPGVEGFIKHKLPLISKLKTKCIVSVGGFSNKEYEEIIRKLVELNGVDAFEINLSCPNLKLKKLVSQNSKATYTLVKLLRKLTKKSLFVKITPEVTDIVQIAKAVEDGGADAVSLVNTYFSMAIDIESQKPILGNVYGGYSGRAVKPMSLYKVWKVAQNVNIPVIGGGGIENFSDAIEFILAGATAVSLGTVNLVDPDSSKTVLIGIKEYMKKKKITDINDIRGLV
ncbi:MAG: dihydroorotate dehydrogenase [Candidatus Omnitrophica bacterium]|nr:dihydroorotate dehydrogenase [Candidatus Omnitrophota bacterium]MCK5393713.1 dihydroorotate dehydrogenase [Candidatus Omnitrophota bacterium]